MWFVTTEFFRATEYKINILTHTNIENKILYNYVLQKKLNCKKTCKIPRNKTNKKCARLLRKLWNYKILMRLK